MDETQIASVLSRDDAITPMFYGIYARDELVTLRHPYPKAYIVNTDPAHRPGIHWVGLFFDETGRGEFYDTFGRFPFHKEFEDFLNRNATDWEWNHQIVQHPLSSACGPHCIFYLLLRARGFSMSRIVNTFSSDLLENDQLVTVFTSNV